MRLRRDPRRPLADLLARLALGLDHRSQRQQPRGQDRLLPRRRVVYGDVYVELAAVIRTGPAIALSATCAVRDVSLQPACHTSMPEEEYVWLPRADVLSLRGYGPLRRRVHRRGRPDKVRLPSRASARRTFDRLVRLLADNPRLRDLALTTTACCWRSGWRAPAAGLRRSQSEPLHPCGRTAFTAAHPRDKTHPRVLEASRGRQSGCPAKLDTCLARGGTIRAGRPGRVRRGGRGRGSLHRVPLTWGVPQLDHGAVVLGPEMLERWASATGPPRPIVPSAEEEQRRARRRFSGACPHCRLGSGASSSTTEPFCPPATCKPAQPPRPSGTSASTRTRGLACRVPFGWGLARRAAAAAPDPSTWQGLGRDRALEDLLALPRAPAADPLIASSSAIPTSRCHTRGVIAVDGVVSTCGRRSPPAGLRPRLFVASSRSGPAAARPPCR